MFFWPCIIVRVYHYSDTNVMHFSFSLLRIKGLYMFRVSLVHPQEAPHKRHLVYCVRVMSVGCTRTGVELQSLCKVKYFAVVHLLQAVIKSTMVRTHTGEAKWIVYHLNKHVVSSMLFEVGTRRKWRVIHPAALNEPIWLGGYPVISLYL
jgi:hypothetical protein